MSEEITQSKYWKEVKALAKDCVKQAKEYDRDLSDVIPEVCDGHRWVIYTFYHHQVLQHTGQDVAERFEEYGGPDLKSGWGGVTMQAAYLALEGDVVETIQDLFKEESK